MTFHHLTPPAPLRRLVIFFLLLIVVPIGISAARCSIDLLGLFSGRALGRQSKELGRVHFQARASFPIISSPT
jgi:hypothetical protein